MLAPRALALHGLVVAAYGVRREQQVWVQPGAGVRVGAIVHVASGPDVDGFGGAVGVVAPKANIGGDPSRGVKGPSGAVQKRPHATNGGSK